MEIEQDSQDPRVRNEVLFRTVNNKLRALNVEFEGFAGETALFVCECSRLDCIDQIDLPLAVFDELCASPARFVVLSGHDSPDLEVVVDRADGYLIVEKRRS